MLVEKSKVAGKVLSNEEGVLLVSPSHQTTVNSSLCIYIGIAILHSFLLIKDVKRRGGKANKSTHELARSTYNFS